MASREENLEKFHPISVGDRDGTASRGSRTRWPVFEGMFSISMSMAAAWAGPIEEPEQAHTHTGTCSVQDVLDHHGVRNLPLMTAVKNTVNRPSFPNDGRSPGVHTPHGLQHVAHRWLRTNSVRFPSWAAMSLGRSQPQPIRFPLAGRSPNLDSHPGTWRAARREL